MRAGIVQIDRNKPSGSREAEGNDPHRPPRYARGSSRSAGAARLQHAAPGKAARRESCKKEGDNPRDPDPGEVAQPCSAPSCTQEPALGPGVKAKGNSWGSSGTVLGIATKKEISCLVYMRMLGLFMGEKKRRKKKKSLAEGSSHCQSGGYCEISPGGSAKQL